MPLCFNEIDYFMLAMDDLHREMTGRGNICCLALELDSTPEAALCELRRMVERSFAVRWLTTLRLDSSGAFGGACWSELRTDSAEVLELEGNRPLSDIVSSIDLDPRIDPPFRVALVRSIRPVALFFWHHSILDAHGAEALVARFCEGSHTEEKARAPATVPLLQKISRAREAKRWLFSCAREPLAPPLAPFERRKGAVHTVVRFDPEETRRIDDRCKRLGMELFKSSVLLAACAAAFRDLYELRGIDPGAFLVPVPHDTRRSVKSATALSNQLSFLFYRIESTDLVSIERAARAILDQAQEMVGRELGSACPAMLGLFSRLPFPLYRRLVLSPSKGQLASFCFSDTGDSLSRLRSLGDLRVADARHFPPNFYPPGSSFVCSRRDGELTIVIVTASGIFEDSELSLLADRSRAYLLGEAG